MKKKIITIYLLSSSLAYGQKLSSENMKQYLPDVIPAAPSVANLMKFEEVPVNNYTGVPDISFPLGSVPTSIPNIPINIALKYHIYNAKSDSKASEVGLGWSLLAGGSISRTVVGSPDEMTVSLSANKVKIGMYYDELTSTIASRKNYFHMIIDDPNLASQFIDINQYAFDTYFGNKYDSQYDLYQYNFMNYTGRFIVKKVGNILQAVKLDKNNLKIKVNHSITVDTRSAFEPLSFEITDDQGNVFIFDVTEKSTMNKLSSSEGLFGQLYTEGSTLINNYNSAYHLSKIKKNELDIVRLSYADPTTIVTADRVWYRNRYGSTIDQQASGIIANESSLPRKSENHMTTTRTESRSLQEIEVVDRGKINFEYEYGRQDSNFEVGSNQPSLKRVIIKSKDGQYDESYDFNYSYKNKGISKRLFLSSVEKKNKKDNSYILNQKYTFGYYGDSGILLPSYPELVAGNDRFFSCAGNLAFTKCPSAEVLQSIVYPTKGKVEFVFESNTYSYKPQITSDQATGAEEITNFDGNPLNWDTYNTDVSFNNFNQGYKFAFSFINQTNVSININSSQIDPYSWLIKIYRKEGNNYIYIPGADFGSAFDQNLQAPTSVERQLSAGEYYFKLVKLDNNNYPDFLSNFHSTYSVRNSNNYKFLFDNRGIRIGNIRYFSADNGSTPDRIMNFNYQDLNDSKKSTGALVFPLPITSYDESYRTILEYAFGQGITTENFSAELTRISSRDYLAAQKTKGSDIGYQYVTVYESDKGKTVYQYTSPIDKPNLYSPSGQPPFIPVPNYDFMRGNLLNRKIYNQNNILLSESKFQYSFNSDLISTGGGFEAKQKGSAGYYLYGGKYASYLSYVIAANGGDGAASAFGTDVSSFLQQISYSELVGTTNMTQEEQIQYYPNQHSVKQVQDNTYNALDYLTRNKVTYPDNTVTETSYQYASEKGNQLLISKNMIRIPLETETKKNGETISKVESLYPISQADADTKTSGLALPYQINSTDLLNTTSKEVTYDNYDEKGNLLQYTTRDGISTVIIWGYNKTLPIAKIVGIILSEIPDVLITNVVNSSNADAVNPANESALINDLVTFRKAIEALPRRTPQISTFTYDQLIGVTTITPPSGIREYYVYDTAGQLEKVINMDGKVLKETKYNYKN
ncbi:hypothetical protein [Chryseobacterium sp. 22543]|uniref:hypothetical protein n=1 Tax=Chryseobacterium sp. 22543 TaxID=3453940 RepID=UPI003F84EB77